MTSFSLKSSISFQRRNVDYWRPGICHWYFGRGDSCLISEVSPNHTVSLVKLLMSHPLLYHFLGLLYLSKICIWKDIPIFPVGGVRCFSHFALYFTVRRKRKSVLWTIKCKQRLGSTGTHTLAITNNRVIGFKTHSTRMILCLYWKT